MWTFPATIGTPAVWIFRKAAGRHGMPPGWGGSRCGSMPISSAVGRRVAGGSQLPPHAGKGLVGYGHPALCPLPGKGIRQICPAAAAGPRLPGLRVSPASTTILSPPGKLPGSSTGMRAFAAALTKTGLLQLMLTREEYLARHPEPGGKPHFLFKEHPPMKICFYALRPFDELPTAGSSARSTASTLPGRRSTPRRKTSAWRKAATPSA